MGRLERAILKDSLGYIMAFILSISVLKYAVSNGLINTELGFSITYTQIILTGLALGILQLIKYIIMRYKGYEIE